MNILLLMTSLTFAADGGRPWWHRANSHGGYEIYLRKPISCKSYNNRIKRAGGTPKWECDDGEKVESIDVATACKSYVSKQAKCVDDYWYVDSYNYEHPNAKIQKKIDSCKASCRTSQRLDACNSKYNQGTKARRKCRNSVFDCSSNCSDKYHIKNYCTSPTYDSCAINYGIASSVKAEKAAKQAKQRKEDAKNREAARIEAKRVAEEKATEAAWSNPKAYKGGAVEVFFTGKDAGLTATLMCSGKRDRQKIRTQCLDVKQYSWKECENEERRVVFKDTGKASGKCTLVLSPSSIRTSIQLSETLYCNVKGSYMSCSSSKP